MKAEDAQYKVTGIGPFAVKTIEGAIEYDLIDSLWEADDICRILNQGIGPEWDKVEPHMQKAGRA